MNRNHSDPKSKLWKKVSMETPHQNESHGSRKRKFSTESNQIEVRIVQPNQLSAEAELVVYEDITVDLQKVLTKPQTKESAQAQKESEQKASSLRNIPRPSPLTVGNPIQRNLSFGAKNGSQNVITINRISQKSLELSVKEYLQSENRRSAHFVHVEDSGKAVESAQSKEVTPSSSLKEEEKISSGLRSEKRPKQQEISFEQNSFFSDEQKSFALLGKLKSTFKSSLQSNFRRIPRKKDEPESPYPLISNISMIKPKKSQKNNHQDLVFFEDLNFQEKKSLVSSKSQEGFAAKVTNKVLKASKRSFSIQTEKMQDPPELIQKITQLTEKIKFKSAKIEKFGGMFQRFFNELKQLAYLYRNIKKEIHNVCRNCSQYFLQELRSLQERVFDFELKRRQFTESSRKIQVIQATKPLEEEVSKWKVKFMQSQSKNQQIESELKSLQRKIQSKTSLEALSNQETQAWSKRLKSVQQQFFECKVELERERQKGLALKTKIQQTEKYLKQNFEELTQLQRASSVKNKNLKEEYEKLESKYQREGRIHEKNQSQYALNLQSYQSEILEVQKVLFEYSQRNEKKVEQMTGQLIKFEEKFEDDQKVIRELEEKLRQQTEQHNRKIRSYDKILNGVENDLQKIALQRTSKSQELQEQQRHLLSRQNAVRDREQEIRQKGNELECAIELYKNNVKVLEKKEEFLGNRYNQEVEAQISSKAAWYERYYKLYSPTMLQRKSPAERQNKGAENYHNQEVLSLKSDNQQDRKSRSDFKNSLKKNMVTQRLDEIGSVKSFKPTLASARSVNLGREQIQNQKPLSRIRSQEKKHTNFNSPHQKDIGKHQQGASQVPVSAPKFELRSPKPDYSRNIEVIHAKIQHIKSSIKHEMKQVA